jgi:hypothetical protein
MHVHYLLACVSNALFPVDTSLVTAALNSHGSTILNCHFNRGACSISRYLLLQHALIVSFACYSVCNVQVTAVNTAGYTLLASDDVSVVCDNRYIGKSSLPQTIVSREIFDVYFGVDPTIKVMCQ